VRPLPADTRVAVRTGSALGLKYLELKPGRSATGLAEGATLPLAAARPETVDLDEVLNVFDERTREAQSRNLAGLGGALAGRGPALNATLGSLPATLALLEPVGRNLAAPETRLGRFIRASAAAAAEAGPVGERQAQLFRALATTFEALAASQPGLGRTIERSPAALRQARQSLPAISGLIRHSTTLFAELRPGARTLVGLAPELDRAFELAEPALTEAPRLNRELPPTTAALRAFGEDAGALAGIAALTRASAELSPALTFVAPAQTTCNYAALLLRNLASVFALGDGLGTRQRFISFQPPLGPDGEGSPAAAPADGPGAANHLHVNPYPNTAAPGQEGECEAGNEPYEIGRTVIGNAAGNQGTVTEASR
jgi:ABC-type transporter Mla subunit MlaD